MSDVPPLEVMLLLDAPVLEKMMDQAQVDNARELVYESLTLLRWALEEAHRGRLIVSCAVGGEEVERLAMPVLEKILDVTAPRPPKEPEGDPTPD